MKKLMVIAIAAFVLFSGCVKKGPDQVFEEKEIAGVKVIKNSGTPADPDLKIVPELLFKITSTADDGTVNFERLQQIAVVSDGSFFAADPGTFSIRKFSPEGKLVTSFGKQGNGPGEFMMMNTGLCAVGDRILVPDPMTMGVKIFDTEGNFVENVNTAQRGIGMIIMPDSFSETEFMALNSTVAQKEEKIIMSTKLSVFTEGLNERSSVWSIDQEFDPQDIAKMMSMGKDYPSYTAGEGIIYISQSGTDKYEITVYDPNGSILYKISMQFRKIRYTEEEKKEMADAVNSYVDPAAKQFMKDYKFEEEFKKAVNTMYVDGKGMLWVEKSFESSAGDEYLRKIDVFKDGVYQNTFDLKDSEGNDVKGIIKIRNERLYAVDFENNEICVYKLTL